MFYKYFLEIQNRFFLVIYGCIFSLTICYFYKETLLFLLMKPIYSIQIYFIFTNITEILTTYLKLIYFLSNQIFLICFVYHTLMFLVPGLYYFEYQLLIKIVFLSIFSLFFSIVLLNTTILPACWYFFLSFQKTITSNSVNLYFEAKINEYINFYVNLYYICNLNCQMFMTVILFSIFIKNNLKTVKKFRKIFYLTFFVFATVITPPDVITQLIFSGIMIIVFEILIFNTLIKNYLISKPIKTN